MFAMIFNYLIKNAEDPYEVFERLMYYYQILTILVALNPTLNFILYFLGGSKFRNEVEALMCCEATQTGSVF